VSSNSNPLPWKLPRPSDEEFERLKRVQMEELNKIVASVCADMGWDPKETMVHTSPGMNSCYCACPDGPCQHKWNGPEHSELDESDKYVVMVSGTCSLCGAVQAYHDIRFMD
jgi:hypothetical protein